MIVIASKPLSEAKEASVAIPNVDAVSSYHASMGLLRANALAMTFSTLKKP
jgi:hypothetical protein